MGACKDPRLTYLNDQGYNVVRLPRKGIVPLGVIGRDGNARNWLGTIDQIWTSPVPVPKPGDPQPAAGIKGTKTSDLKISFGLEILANALSGMFGSTVPSLDAAYKDAKSVQFSFKEVQSVGIDPFVIGNFLAKGDLSGGPVVKRFFTGQQHVEALIVTEVLQSKSIGVIGKKDSGTEVGVNVPQIQATLGAKINVSLATGSQSEVVYEGQDFLVFGYKAFGIAMVNGEWTIHGIDVDAENAFAIGSAPDPLVDSNQLVDIDFNPPKH
ncbi:MAG TPA: hypothetical protein VGQ27_09475 [Steroidobacteraceae bacterium]|jgi:hypothetical protein|nr:hypothetical protein [Steroidobacteraceae bacterium]